jgi:Flp pilus assembly protein TadG
MTIRAGSAGQAMVELALILPVTLLGLLGVLAVGQIAHEYQAVRAAATQAAFAAARAPSLSDAHVKAQAAGLQAASGSGVQDLAVTLDAGTFPRGGTLTTYAEGYVDLGAFGPAADLLGRRFKLRWQAHALIEPYRSRTQ